MEQTRKRTMRCTHPTPCEICLTDCKRAEITAKEDRIRPDLLAACKQARDYISEVLASERRNFGSNCESDVSLKNELKAAIKKAEVCND